MDFRIPRGRRELIPHYRATNSKRLLEKSSLIVDFPEFYITFASSIAREEMEVIFNEKYLQEMYLTGQTDKKHRYQPQVVRKYIRVIDIMIDAPDVQGLLRYNSLNYEKLKGDKAGLSSVRVNDQYRIEFEEQTREGETIATICNITDLSNHYK